MSADQLIQYLSWTIFILIFTNSVIQVVRHSHRANLDIALLFLVPALIIAIGLLALTLIPVAMLLAAASVFAGSRERRPLVITVVVVFLLAASLVAAALIGASA